MRPVDEYARRDAEDLFGALLDTGHSIEEAAEFLTFLASEQSDADMRITMES